jgi:hypothetical protein
MNPHALRYLAPTTMRVNGEAVHGDVKAAWKAILDEADVLVSFDAAPEPYTHAVWLLEHGTGRDVTVLMRLEDDK